MYLQLRGDPRVQCLIVWWCCYRGLLDDTEFHDSCQKVLSAQTPFYCQFPPYELPHYVPEPLSDADLVAPEVTFGSPVPPTVPSVEGADSGSSASILKTSSRTSFKRPRSARRSKAPPCGCYEH